MFTAENGKTVTSSAAQTARFMWMLLARRMVNVSASVASNVIRNSGCGKRKDVNFCAWRRRKLKHEKCGDWCVCCGAGGHGRRCLDGDYAERRAERGDNVFHGGR